MKGRVIIFSITGCPFCLRAKNKMQKLGIDFIDINLDNYPERRAEAKERSGRNTVPQIFFNNRHIGGFNDFDKLSEAELQVLIKEVEENPAPPDAPQPPSPGDSKNEEFHVLARRSPYPGSNQQRYPVPDFLVDWQESFPSYDPPLYTAQASPPGADPDILHPSNTSVVTVRDRYHF